MHNLVYFQEHQILPANHNKVNNELELSTVKKDRFQPYFEHFLKKYSSDGNFLPFCTFSDFFADV